MAAMSTALTEFSDSGNSRTYTQAGHTTVLPKLVIQKRKIAVSETGVAEDTIMVVDAAVDSNAVVLASKNTFEVKVRRPVNGAAAGVAASLATFRDIINGDEFANTVTTQEWVV